MIIVDKYNLPDKSLLHPNDAFGRFLVFSPSKTMIVLGRASKISDELKFEQVERDKLQVIRRFSGGCSVLISPKTLIVSFALYNFKKKNSNDYFKMFNEIIIEAFKNNNISGLESNGISDLTLIGKKIAGSSIYYNKDVVFYHTVINLCEDPKIFGRYLKFPPRVPSYRRNREHEDFITSLKQNRILLNLVTFERELLIQWSKLDN